MTSQGYWHYGDEGDAPESASSHPRSSHRVPRTSRPSGSRRSSQSVPDAQSQAPPQESRQGCFRSAEQPAPPPHRLRRGLRDITRLQTGPEEPGAPIARGSRRTVPVPVPDDEEYQGLPPPPYNPALSSVESLPTYVPPQPAADEQAQAAPGLAEPPSLSGLQDVQSTDAIIAVMGMTGSGKTTFVSHFCATARAGHGLESATSQVEAHLSHQTVRGRRLILVDTPGFDDTHRTDTEILRSLATWLASAFELNIKLTGLVYLHGVNNTRVPASALTNMRYFRELCGDGSMTSVALATTHWSRDPRERSRQELRHRELSVTDLFWGQMIERGAQVFKHDNGVASAWAVVNYLMDRNSAPGSGIYPQLAQELASGLTLEQTTVGAAFNRQIQELSAVYQNRINELTREMNEMRRQWQRDSRRIEQIAEDREGLEAEIRHIQKKLERERESRKRLEVTARDLRREGDRRRKPGPHGRHHHGKKRGRDNGCLVM